MSVPLFWNAEGLPVGKHFVRRFGDEARLFRLAAQLEAAALGCSLSSNFLVTVILVAVALLASGKLPVCSSSARNHRMFQMQLATSYNWTLSAADFLT